ncbi:hypothetical protein AB0H29_15905 [Streptomyces thermolilacinus]
MATNHRLEQLESTVQASRVEDLSSNEWEQIREICVNHMQDEGGPTPLRLRWARLALRAISGKYNSHPPLREKRVADEAWVRAYAVRALMQSAAERTAESTRLCAYVLGHMDLSREAASQASSTFSPSRPQEMLHLRRIKNMLSPLTQVYEFLEDGTDLKEETAAWLDLLPRLP